jgi:hypothetical protein
MKITSIVQGESYNGYYLFTPSADFFFITNDRRRHLHMVATIKHYLHKHHGFKNIYMDGTDVKNQLQLGTIELKSCSHGDYYSINGDGWGCGDLVKNRKTIIYQYDKVHL